MTESSVGRTVAPSVSKVDASTGGPTKPARDGTDEKTQSPVRGKKGNKAFAAILTEQSFVEFYFFTIIDDTYFSVVKL